MNCLKELLQNRDLDSDDENYMDGNVMDPLYEEEADETNSTHDEEEFSEENFQ